MSNEDVLIEFFYDVISPYSFLAFEVLQRYKTIWKIDVKLKPMTIYDVRKESGNPSPAANPFKRDYTLKDIKRLQKLFQVPVFLPKNILEIIARHASINAMKFITSVELSKPEYLEEISRELWLRVFKDHKDIENLESLKEAGQSINMDPEVLENCLQSIKAPHVKDKLKKNTEEALKLGAFGAPFIVAHINGEPQALFGSDRFELLAFLLGEKWLGPVPPKVPSF